jgi:hypothetical protein
MIGIQFGIYEFMRRSLVDRKVADDLQHQRNKGRQFKRSEDAEDGGVYGSESVFEETFMEVAASADDPCPAPHILERAKQNARKIKTKTRSTWQGRKR